MTFVVVVKAGVGGLSPSSAMALAYFAFALTHDDVTFHVLMQRFDDDLEAYAKSETTH